MNAPAAARTRTLVVLQPGYLPWLGFFDQMRRADVFVYYDDVQYDKHGWRNRNRVKSAEGPVWLTVPVRNHGLGQPKILDAEIDTRTPWARKHIGTVRQHYAKAPFFKHYAPELEELLQRPWTHIVDLDLAVTAMMGAWLQLAPEIHRSSALGIEGTQSLRLLKLCQHFGATRYLSGSSARDYLDLPLFESNGLRVEWQDYRHPTYPQLHGDFIPYLSALDLLLNCGDESRAILESGNPQ